MSYGDQIWYTRCEVPTASALALRHGLLESAFAAQGFELGVLQDAPLPLSLAHYSHNLTSLIREGGNVPAIVARAEGANTRLIGLTFFDEGQMLVARQDFVKYQRSLRGARIAIPAFASAKNASHARAMAIGGFEAVLATLSLNLSDTIIVETAVPETVPPGKTRSELKIPSWPTLHQVANGDADLAYVKGASGRQAAQSLGLEVFFDIDQLPTHQRVNNGTPRPITVHAELLDRRPEVVLSFLVQTLKAASWARANTQEFYKILSSETGANRQSVEMPYALHSVDKLVPDLSDERLDLLDIQIDRLHRHGFIDFAFVARDWAAPELLKAAFKQL